MFETPLAILVNEFRIAVVWYASDCLVFKGSTPLVTHLGLLASGEWDFGFVSYLKNEVVVCRESLGVKGP